MNADIQKTWHNGTADAFAVTISRLPIAISELFDYSQVLFVYDDLDAAQVLLSKGTHPQASAATSGKMEKRFLVHLKSVLVGSIHTLLFICARRSFIVRRHVLVKWNSNQDVITQSC